MQGETDRAAASPAGLVARAAELRKDGKWEELAALAGFLPQNWGREWAAVASEAAFGVCRLGRADEAISLLQRVYELEPTHRTASSLAFVHYDVLLRHKVKKPRLDDPEPYRKGFEKWIAEALRLRPQSAVDRYRLGLYHASIQHRKDLLALGAFRSAIACFESLPPELRTPQNRLFKVYVRALYAAARSAYRLGRHEEARRWIFRCIRVDRGHDHREPVFKLFLAAKVLFAQKQYRDAERALRLALEAPHQGQRDFVYALLAEIALAEERWDDAAQWIELHVPPHVRKPYLWRILGDAELGRGRPERALKLYKSALLKDRVGRHKTLVRIGKIEEQLGRTRNARRAYEQAADFRRRRYLSEDPTALEALAQLCEKEGDLDAAREAYARMARLPAFAKKAEAELARLAG